MIQLSIIDYRRIILRSALTLSLLIVVGLCSLSFADTEDQKVGVKWIAPVAKAQKTNPVPADSTSIGAGRKIYMQRCAKCHGDSGKGDGHDAIELKLRPAKFTGSALHDESDGALFWKISVGNGKMPDFGKRLSPTERWSVINFLRTLGN